MTAEEDIAKMRGMLAEHGASKWELAVSEWTEPRDDHAFWIIHAASYLFNFSGFRVAVDPVRPQWRIPESGNVNVQKFQHGLELVILTHHHQDHCDFTLWQEMESRDCHWIIPGHMHDYFWSNVDNIRGTIGWITPGDQLNVGPLAIDAYDGWHYENQPDGSEIVVNATAYTLSDGNKRVFLPGDVRTYDVSRIPPGMGWDLCMAHVWLGRVECLNPKPPLTDDFVNFFNAVETRKLALTHLYECSREPDSVWLQWHAEMLKEKLIGDRYTGNQISISDFFVREQF
jgi:hypothetical protein